MTTKRSSQVTLAAVSAALFVALAFVLGGSKVAATYLAQGDGSVSIDRAEVVAQSLEGYAGVYLDEAQGTPVFVFVEGSPNPRPELRSVLGETPFEVETAGRSVEELRRLQERVWRARGELKEAGVAVVATGIQFSSNRVRVGVVDLAQSKTVFLEQMFGGGLLPYNQGQPVWDSCHIEACWQPSGSDVGMKGGLEMNQGSVSPYCTGGFLGTRANGDVVLLTAGHCIALGTGQVFKHNGYTIGSQGSVETWYDGSNADAGLVTLNVVPDNLNRYLQSDGGSGLDNVTVVGTGQENEKVCRMGAGSKDQGFAPRKCGKIVDVLGNNESCKPDGTSCKTIHLTATVNFDSCGGDSGGAVFQDPADYSTPNAMGTHVSSDDGCQPNQPGKQGWYSPLNKSIDEILDSEGITFTINTQP